MQKRQANVTRKTKETQITVSLVLDGRGTSSIDTGVPFLDHMLTLVGTHGLFDLRVTARGDLDVDLHHTNEDVGLVLGQAVDQALGERRGITRFGFVYVPMDEALARAVIDCSGRAKLVLRDSRPDLRTRPLRSSSAYRWGDAEHFLESLVRTSRITAHIDLLAGHDFHHSCEAVFKAFGRALAMATQRDPRISGVPSSKGRL